MLARWQRKRGHTLLPLSTDSVVVTMSKSLLTTATSKPAQDPASSSNFQSIFNAALDVYEEKTKKALITHPLAAQLQACSSPIAILTVLQDIVKDVEKSRSTDEKLFRWLTPTINILYAFSSTLGVGAGLVSHIRSKYPLQPHYTYSADVLARNNGLLWYRSSPYSEQSQ